MNRCKMHTPLWAMIDLDEEDIRLMDFIFFSFRCRCCSCLLEIQSNDKCHFSVCIEWKSDLCTENFIMHIEIMHIYSDKSDENATFPPTELFKSVAI